MAVLPGEGTLLQLEAATPGTFDTIAQRVTIEGPERSVEAVETTHLDSVAKQFRPSKTPDNGELSMTIEFDPADVGHLRLETLAATTATVNWRLVFNNETNTRPHRQFPGFITSFGYGGMETESNLTADITIKVTGPLTAGNTTITPPP